jgi:hypothetical protein
MHEHIVYVSGVDRHGPKPPPPRKVRQLQDPGWKDALLGKATDFAELAADMGVASASISQAVRFAGRATLGP